MVYTSFIESDSYGEGSNCSRLSFSVEVNAIEWCGLAVTDTAGNPIELEIISERDMAAILDLVHHKLQEERKKHLDGCEFLRSLSGRPA